MTPNISGDIIVSLAGGLTPVHNYTDCPVCSVKFELFDAGLGSKMLLSFSLFHVLKQRNSFSLSYFMNKQFYIPIHAKKV